MTFLGDVYLDKKYDIDFPINDIVFNLEFPISKEGVPARNKVNLKSETPYILDTFNSIPKAVCLANNHIMDYGVEAFDDTLQYLNSESINYFGAGIRNDNYNNPAILKIENKSIAVLGYACPSTHPSELNGIGASELIIENVLQDITNIRKNVDFMVLQFHWGEEEIPFPKYSDVEIAHKCIDAGADLIIGHHAHVVQSYEEYNGKYIFYGIGNFIFPDLYVDSMHNGEEFTSTYVKKQNKENRESIVVTLDDRLKVDFFTIEFKDGIVKKKKISIPTWIPVSEQSFYKRLSNQKKINMLKKFIRNPKVPNINHFKRLLGLKK
ncbi:MAG TPA: CapA family protein [Lutibacter sp.]|nr:CapA family protein [Lutibacter sp.]